jgi:hypothetical protein
MLTAKKEAPPWIPVIPYINYGKSSELNRKLEKRHTEFVICSSVSFLFHNHVCTIDFGMQ